MTRRPFSVSRLARAARRILLPAALLGAACSTPSVPLPPPEVDVAALSFTAASPGELVLKSKPSLSHRNVRFFAINRATGEGVIATGAADGSFTTGPLAAKAGDTAELSFETATGDAAAATCVVIVVDGPLFGETCQ